MCVYVSWTKKMAKWNYRGYPGHEQTSYTHYHFCVYAHTLVHYSKSNIPISRFQIKIDILKSQFLVSNNDRTSCSSIQSHLLMLHFKRNSNMQTTNGDDWNEICALNIISYHCGNRFLLQNSTLECVRQAAANICFLASKWITLCSMYSHDADFHALYLVQ